MLLQARMLQDALLATHASVHVNVVVNYLCKRARI